MPVKLKTKIRKAQTKTLNYPYVAVEKFSGAIVFVMDEGSGVVLQGLTEDREDGHYYDNLGKVEPLSEGESVTLSNDYE